MQGMFALCAFTFYRENSAWFKKLKWTTGDTPEYGRLFEQTSWITIHTKKCHAIIQCVYAFSVIYRSSISLRLKITDIYVIHVITECMKMYRNWKMCFYVWSEIYWLPMHNMVSWVIISSWYTKDLRKARALSAWTNIPLWFIAYISSASNQWILFYQSHTIMTINDPESDKYWAVYNKQPKLQPMWFNWFLLKEAFKKHGEGEMGQYHC